MQKKEKKSVVVVPPSTKKHHAYLSNTSIGVCLLLAVSEQFGASFDKLFF